MSITYLIECELDKDEKDVRDAYEKKLECEVIVSKCEKTNICKRNRNFNMFRVSFIPTERVNQIIEKEIKQRGYFYISIVKLQNSLERAQLISNMFVLV